MSIKSTLDNMKYNVEDTLSGTLSSAKSKFDSIVGTTTTSFSNIWAGGFTGMDQKGLEQLKTDLKSYCAAIDDIIRGFDETGDISEALKGDTQTAAIEFIKSVKELLVAYVSTMKQEIAELDQAYENFKSASSSISSDVKSHASDIRSEAQRITLD